MIEVNSEPRQKVRAAVPRVNGSSKSRKRERDHDGMHEPHVKAKRKIRTDRLSSE